MDEVTQQNSALVEENAATAKVLEHQARAMDEQMTFFQIASDAKGQDASSVNEPGEMRTAKEKSGAGNPSRRPKQQPAAA